MRIRSAEAANLKTLLKRIIRDATTRGSEDDEDQDLAVGKDVSLQRKQKPASCYG